MACPSDCPLANVNKTQAYVRGRVHVNGMENFWSLLKRSLKGTYVALEPFHLDPSMAHYGVGFLLGRFHLTVLSSAPGVELSNSSSLRR